MKPINHSFATSLTLAFCSGLALSFLQGCSLLGGAMICGSPQHVEARNEYLANGGTNPEYPPCTCGEYEWLEYATKCDGESCLEGGGNGGEEDEGGETGGQNECVEEPLPCVQGGLLCTGVVCVCDANAASLIAKFGQAQVNQWMNEGQLGTTQGTCEGILYKTSCLFDGIEQSKVYHGSIKTHSWEMLEHQCAACYNRSEELEQAYDLLNFNPPEEGEIYGEWPEPAKPYSYPTKSGGEIRVTPLCFKPVSSNDGWPSLKPTYASKKVRPLFGNGFGGYKTGRAACAEGEIEVISATPDGPVCMGLLDCSLFCGGIGDDTCISRLEPITDVIGGIPACALSPNDPSNINAACGIGFSDGSTPFTNIPDLLSGLVWENEVNCIDSGGITQCTITQVMLEAIIYHPQALFGGALLDVNMASGSIEILNCRMNSGCTLLGLGEGDAIMGLGENMGTPSHVSVAMQALDELNRGETWAWVNRAGRQVIYQIILR